MSDAQRELDKFALAERLRNLKAPALLVVFLLFLGSLIYYFNRGDWVSSEIVVTMRSIVLIEDNTRLRYSALVEKEDGTQIHVTMPQSSHFREGGSALVMESKNIESGKRKYRYLRPAPDY